MFKLAKSETAVAIPKESLRRPAEYFLTTIPLRAGKVDGWRDEPPEAVGDSVRRRPVIHLPLHGLAWLEREA